MTALRPQGQETALSGFDAAILCDRLETVRVSYKGQSWGLVSAKFSSYVRYFAELE